MAEVHVLSHKPSDFAIYLTVTPGESDSDKDLSLSGFSVPLQGCSEYTGILSHTPTAIISLSLLVSGQSQAYRPTGASRATSLANGGLVSFT